MIIAYVSDASFRLSKLTNLRWGLDKVRKLSNAIFSGLIGASAAFASLRPFPEHRPIPYSDIGQLHDWFVFAYCLPSTLTGETVAADGKANFLEGELFASTGLSQANASLGVILMAVYLMIGWSFFCLIGEADAFFSRRFLVLPVRVGAERFVYLRVKSTFVFHGFSAFTLCI